MNDRSGRFALDCWTQDDPHAREPGLCVFTDHDGQLGELIVHASDLIRLRTYRFIELCELDGSSPDGWRRLVRLTAPEQLPGARN